MEELRTLRTRFRDGGADGPSPSSEDVQGRIAELIELMEGFGPALDASESSFREDRRRHLTELQSRLRRLDGRS